MFYFTVKRIFDFCLALIGLLLFLPLIILISLLLLFREGSPIFYVKRSLGKKGKIFDIAKFRSIDKKSLNITKTGEILRRTAMDELPQLLAILKGDMSFVGPRPYRVEEYGLSKDVKAKRVKISDLDSTNRIFAKRLKVTPGLTGLAQVFAPKHADKDDVLKRDLAYIKEKNFLLDLYLICVSVWITLRGAWERTVAKKL